MGVRVRGRAVSIGFVWALWLAGCSGDDGHSDSNATAGASGTAAGGKSNASNTGGQQPTGGAGSSAGSGGATGGGSAHGGTGGSVDLMSDPGSGTCTNFTPCGGDVSGTWQIQSLCWDFLGEIESCPTAQGTLEISGSLTFGVDGSYSANGSITTHLVFPAECSALCSLACSGPSDGACVCDGTSSLSGNPSTYSASGNRLLLTDAQWGHVQTAYYCVNGVELRLRGYSSNGTPYQYDLHR